MRWSRLIPVEPPVLHCFKHGKDFVTHPCEEYRRSEERTVPRVCLFCLRDAKAKIKAERQRWLSRHSNHANGFRAVNAHRRACKEAGVKA